ncbi:hypothetical protein [Mesorhizobium sp. B2-8-5]|uniref:hypothetical protein n=1 Tax=Mesorhizobium sp. B2-8-5 TaxID=2589903 RepID=UPI001129C598|nr:hypothetical protein [Mesorhizobium sp. B2-8-5]UCI24260.1 hypothetical protein FJ430_22025 [Mesorhizobium sp. B2-8-5]
MLKTMFAGLIVLTGSLAASIATAETINVSDAHGGSVAAYSQRWKGLAARGVDVRIVGKCQSACTVLLGYVPRNRICVTPAASFGFHLAHRPDMTALLWKAYASDIRGWIKAHGGLETQLKWMSAPDTYRYFHKC